LIYRCGSPPARAILPNVKIPLIFFAAALAFSVASPGAWSKDAAQERLVDDALADISKKKFDAALEKLLEAERLDPDSAVILNLLGAVHTKKKDYQTAKSCFERSLAREPGFFAPAFNLGELLFLDGCYSQALDSFSKMLNADPSNELLQFKTVLCLLLMDRTEDAQKVFERMKFPGNGPAWYYAQAALWLKEGDRRNARALLTSAQVIFPEKTPLYDETFENLGWPTR
jgi:tetratricopeptide (TPR) repeat protein